MATMAPGSWPRMLGIVLMSLALLGTSPASGVSAPRLLWNTEPLGG